MEDISYESFPGKGKHLGRWPNHPTRAVREQTVPIPAPHWPCRAVAEAPAPFLLDMPMWISVHSPALIAQSLVAKP